MTMNSDILLYQSDDGQLKIQVRLENETVWLTQADMVMLFQTTKQNISLHIKNIFEEGELNVNSVVMEYLTTAAIAKNYFTERELAILNRLVSAYLDIAEINAIQHKPMYMKDWIEVLDGFLKMSLQDVLTDAGKISAEIAQRKALVEYENYNIKTDEELSEVEKQFIVSIEQAEKKLKNLNPKHNKKR